MTATVDDYLTRIPSQNRVQPNFMATLAAALQPLVDTQNLFAAMPGVFDLDVAVGVQLDQTGLWIGRSRLIEQPITAVYFSWNIEGLGWNQGYWQGRFDPNEGITVLGDEPYRALLRAKVSANQWKGDVPSIVSTLQTMFAGENLEIEVIDNLNMSMTVRVLSTIQDQVFLSILVGGYVPIKPVGVSINYDLGGIVNVSPIGAGTQTRAGLLTASHT